MVERKVILRLLLVLALAIVSLSLVFSTHTTSPKIFGLVNQSLTYTYNITVNNTEAAGNITQVNITLPSGFSFILDTQGTKMNGTFTNSSNETSTVLSWTNETYYLINATINRSYFWFSAIAPSTAGYYNFTVTSVNATGPAYTTNISVTVNGINYRSSTAANGANSSVNSIYVNVSVVEPSFSDISFRLSNYSSGSQLNSTAFAMASLISNNAMNWTGLSDGIYTYNVTVNDSSLQQYTTPNYRITVDTTAPFITLITPAQDASFADAATFSFNVIDSSEMASCLLVIDNVSFNSISSVLTVVTNGIYNSSLAVGSHSWNINCTDMVGLTGTVAQLRFTVTSSGGSDDTGGNAGTTSFWTSTTVLTNDQFTQGYTKELAVKSRVKFTISNSDHYVGVISLASTSAVINISSNPQQASFNIGDEKKFELTNDTYYDLSVKLNSINNSKANITVKSIHELIPPPPVIPLTTPPANNTTNNTGAAGAGNTALNLVKSVLFWVVVIAIVVVVILIIYFYRKSRYYKKGF